ncbi:hypothetical protein C2E31_14775 [Rhodopirellula baltica]|nr:hypothetical protein C2E31_14690 [Rhodopirellula baltica]PNY36111.1 hypothetical protein C2E31_14775 [Rhodopirellula baltica]
MSHSDKDPTESNRPDAPNAPSPSASDRSSEATQVSEPVRRGAWADSHFAETAQCATPLPNDSDTSNDFQHVTSGDACERLDELLEQCLEAYLEAGRGPTPESLRSFLPAEGTETCRFLLTELIKLDMASVAEQEGSPPAIECFIEHFTDLIPANSVPLDLIMEEIQLRKEAGETPIAADYQRRFPNHHDMIGELLGGQLSNKPEATMAVSHKKKPPEYEIGQHVDDFVILQTLGSGAFAKVYLARQDSMSRLVALKVSTGTGDEPQALAQFDHPNIVRVYDQRMLDDPPAHLLYMQFHPGGTLADVVNLVKHTGPTDRSGDMILQCVDRSLLRTAQAVPEQSMLRDNAAPFDLADGSRLDRHPPQPRASKRSQSRRDASGCQTRQRVVVSRRDPQARRLQRQFCRECWACRGGKQLRRIDRLYGTRTPASDFGDGGVRAGRCRCGSRPVFNGNFAVGALARPPTV